MKITMPEEPLETTIAKTVPSMKKRTILSVVLIAYIAILVKVMVFKSVPLIKVGPLMLNFGGTATGEPNFIPLKTILPYVLGYKGWIIAGINLFGNIVLLVPIGILAPIVYRNMTWKKAAILGLVSGLAIEVLQVLLHVGIFDIDDVILNAVGVLVGYGIHRMLSGWIRAKNYKSMLIAGAVVLLLGTAAIYAFYPKDASSATPAVSREGEVGADLCGGTGGTGEIVATGDGTIALKRGDGLVQAITLTDNTAIKNSAGAASESDLKIGQRVTVVIDDTETAALVLVCN